MRKPACERCKRSHKKCSKDKFCSTCKAGGYTDCIYPTEIFTDETSKYVEHYEANNKHGFSATREININHLYDLRAHVEYFSSSITGYLPVMPFEKMKRLLEYSIDICTNRESILTPSKDEIGLLFAMQGMLCRMF